jgi:hypothetical protein
MRIAALWIFSVLLVGLVGFGFYVDRKISAVTRSSGSRLVPSELKLAPAPSTQSFDLGYVAFDFPLAIQGSPVWHEGSSLVVWKSSDVIVSGPIADSDQAVQTLIEGVRGIMPNVPSSLFELRKEYLKAEPFSVWDVPFLGLKGTKKNLMLLLMKNLEVGEAQSIQIFENAEFGVIVITRPSLTSFDFTDKKHKLSQQLVLPPTVNASEVAAALVKTYRFKAPDSRDDTVRTLLRQSGIASHVSPASAPDDTAISISEAERLQKWTDEIHLRRREKAGK